MRNIGITNFTSGEISPKLEGRFDLAKYFNGARLLLNTKIHPQGGATRRPGTYFEGEVKTSSKATRLIPFEFSTTQAYIIEVGDLYFRFFYQGGGQVINGGSPYEIVTPYLEAELFELKFVQSADTMFIVHPNHAPRALTRTAHTSWTLTVMEFTPQITAPYYSLRTVAVAWTVSTGGGTNEYFVRTAGLGDPNLQEPLNVWENGPPAATGGSESKMTKGTVTSLAEGEWGWGDADTLGYSTVYVRLTSPARPNPDSEAEQYVFINIQMAILNGSGSGTDWKYKVSSVKAETYEESLVQEWGEAQIDFAAAIDGTNNVGLNWHYPAQWNGEAVYYYVYRESSGTYGYLGKATEGEYFNDMGDFTPDYSDTPPLERDPFDGADDYPSAISFVEERLGFAGTNNKPQTIWLTKTGHYYNLTVSEPLRDDDAVTLTIASDQVNVIRWLLYTQKLIIGTIGGEWFLSGANEGEPISPLSYLIRRTSNHGSYNLQPIVMGNQVLFLQREGKKVRQYVYDIVTDSWLAPEITLLSEHLTRNNTVEDWAYQQAPDSVLWAVRDDGVMLGLTWLKEQEVYGWHRHTTEGYFESVATIPGSGYDEVWLIVNRTIDGSTVRYVERMMPDLEDETYVHDAFYVDSGLTLDTPITISEATQNDPVRITATSHGFSDDDVISIHEIEGMTELNGRKYIVANKTTHTFELQYEDATDVDGTDFGEYESGGVAHLCVSSVSGLDHLEGEEVQVLGDGAVQAPQTVSSGAITLASPAGIVHAGLAYVSDIETNRPEYVDDQGTIQGRIKRISKVVARVSATNALEVGFKDEEGNLSLDPLPFRTPSDPMGVPIPLFTGDKELAAAGGWNTKGTIYVRQNQPVPMTILSFAAEVEVGFK
jgi:hypothetical protein